jgi:hypothetical protein
VNYIKLINNFWNKEIEKRFSPIETRLFFILLNYSNKLQWKKYLHLSNKKLISEIGCSKNAFFNARNNLQKAGLIRYAKGTLNKAGNYQLTDNPEQTITHTVNQPDVNHSETTETYLNNNNRDTSEDHHSTIRGTTPGTTYGNGYDTKTRNIYKTKLNKTKQNNSSFREKNEKIYSHQIIELFNSICGDCLPPVKSLEDRRKKDLKKRIEDFPDYGTWVLVFKKAIYSDYLSGRSKKWKASFDWIIREKINMIKILDGNYDNPKNAMDVDEWRKWSENDKESIDLWNNDFIESL